MKLNGHAVDLGVLGLEHAVLVGLVADAAQTAADDLLAEELRAEGADAEDVGDGVGVPALGEHRDRHDAADLLAEPARLADRVHHLAQEVLVGDLLLGPVRLAGEELALELLDLDRRDPLERRVHRLTRLELRGVDEQRVGAVDPAVLEARRPGDVAEERQVARHDDRARRPAACRS